MLHSDTIYVKTACMYAGLQFPYSKIITQICKPQDTLQCMLQVP